MEIKGKVAVVTGAGSGIGQAVVLDLANRGVSAIAAVDRAETVGELPAMVAQTNGGQVKIIPFVGDVTDEEFRRHVYDETTSVAAIPQICVPAAGVTRDALAAKVNKESGEIELYAPEKFRFTIEVNLIAPIYWALEMVGRIAKDRFDRGLRRWEPEEGTQGTIIFIGSVSSQGNKGQISYAATKAGLEGAASTLTKEAIFYGVRCGVIHPGFTDTPMVRALGEEHIGKYILPYTQLRRLIKTEEIADAICFMISNSAVTGELWADAGWHPSA